VVLKQSKVVENVTEVMTWLEQQADSGHLHLLHVINIKQYVLEKCSRQF
jgi:L-lactate utilization protein LutC